MTSYIKNHQSFVMLPYRKGAPLFFRWTPSVRKGARNHSAKNTLVVCILAESMEISKTWSETNTLSTETIGDQGCHGKPSVVGVGHDHVRKCVHDFWLRGIETQLPQTSFLNPSSFFTHSCSLLHTDAHISIPWTQDPEEKTLHPFFAYAYASQLN